MPRVLRNYVCQLCNRAFKSSSLTAKFCSVECCNQSRRALPASCLECGELYKRKSPSESRAKRSSEFCSGKCANLYKYNSYIRRWKAGEETGNSTYAGSLAIYVKRYIKEKYGNKCCQCGWAEVHSVTGKVPVEIDHINGDWRDSREENLRLLCPNCHSLTPNYRALNKRPAERTKQKVSRKQF